MASYTALASLRRTATSVLPVEEYEELLEDLHDLAVIAERRDEPTVSFEELGKRNKAYYWTADIGMVDLKTYLKDRYGLDLGKWNLTSANDVSDNGRVIVGRGISPDGQRTAWLIRMFDED